MSSIQAVGDDRTHRRFPGPAFGVHDADYHVDDSNITLLFLSIELSDLTQLKYSHTATLNAK